MMKKPFPVIDPVATGANIVRLREDRGLTVRDLQTYFGFEEPRGRLAKAFRPSTTCTLSVPCSM